MMQAITNALKLNAINGNSEGHNKQKKFPEYYKLLNKNGMLTAQKLALKEQVENDICPFMSDDVPEWWQRYNDTKHDLPEGAYAASIGNVIYALGALAILHDIGELTLRRNSSDNILDKNNWIDTSIDFRSDYENLKHTNSTSGVLHTAERGFYNHKSRIFYYLNEFHPH